MSGESIEGAIALANGHEVNLMIRVAETETRGAPVNPIVPVVVPTPVVAPAPGQTGTKQGK